MVNTRASSDPVDTSLVLAVTAPRWFISDKIIAIYMQTSNLMTNARASSDPGKISFVPTVTAPQWFVNGKLVAIYMQI